MRIRIPLLGAAAFLSAALSVNAQVSLTGVNPSYSQDFDSLSSAASASMPANWKVDKSTSVRALGSYASALGATERSGGAALATNAANGIYNFGATDTPDRAVGFLSSGNATKSGNLYAWFENSTGTTVDFWTISYDVEKYRSGTNSAGFRVELYTSLDGATWTTAGATFLTSFSADAANTGFTTAPGVTSSITNQSLSLSVPAGGSFYLGWNYSVLSGSTTSNAQALAIDNFSISANLSAIPEPSTYAALFGAAAMIGVAVHRRRARAA